MAPQTTSTQAHASASGGGSFATAAFATLMLALTAGLATLGVWQMQRLAEKEALVARVEQRLDLPPAPLPPVAEWVGLDPEVWDYRPVTVTGEFLHDETVLVFTNLTAEARGAQRGPGYWVMTPMALQGGGTVIVNRGFIPESLRAAFAEGGGGPSGVETVTGIARASEEAGAFTPGPQLAGRIDWLRNIERLTAFFDPGLEPIAEVYVDAAAGAEGALPQGGETQVVFPNRHLGYALTWFGLAALTPVMLAFWLWRQARPRELRE